MTKTERARQKLMRQGVSVTEWARRNSLPPSAVFYVLRGGRALRGHAHDAAVLLGVKQGTLRDSRLAA